MSMLMIHGCMSRSLTPLPATCLLFSTTSKQLTSNQGSLFHPFVLPDLNDIEPEARSRDFDRQRRIKVLTFILHSPDFLPIAFT